MNRNLVARGDEAWDILPHLEPLAGTEVPASDSGMDISRLVRLIHEWRWLIIGAAAAGLVGGVILTLMTTPLYRATVMLQANPPTVQVIDEKTQSTGPSVDSMQFVATQIGLLQSRGLAERVVETLGLAKNAGFADQNADLKKRFRQATQKVVDNINVAPQGDAQLIQFSFVWPSPQVAAQVANGYADAFIETSLQRRYEASSYARSFLQRQIAKTRAELQKSERSAVLYAQQQGIIDTSTGKDERSDASSPQGQSLIALNDALAKATADRIAAEGAYREARRSGVTPEVAASTQALRQERGQLQATYEAKRQMMKPDHPQMIALRSQITALDKEIAAETSGGESSKVNSARATYQAALSAEHALEAKVAGLKSNVLNLRGRSIQYAILQRDVDTNRALYDALLQRYKEIGVAAGIGESPVSIVDRADAPTAPFKPNVLLNVIVGLGLGLIAGILTAIGLDILNDTIRSPDDVRRKLKLPFLAAIPNRAGNSKRIALLSELDDPTSPASESYATLATSLRFTTDEGLPRALLLTSAKAAEGKSSSALALAHHFAKLDRSVLLIDCDLRKPTFRGEGDNRGNLTGLLTSNDALKDHVTPTKYPNLSLVQCGAEPPNPAALLASGRFRQIMAEATAQYDLVIVDSPPLLGLADAPLIASVVPAVVIVIEAGRTRTSAVREAIHRLVDAGANILGVTLTKAAAGRSGYGYGYGYGYGGYGKDRYGAVTGKSREMVELAPASED